MKTLVIFSSLLFVTLSLFVPFALSTSPPVVDIHGKALTLDTPYHIFISCFLVLHTWPEGLCLINVNDVQNTHCPHDVVKCSFFEKGILGIPIMFSSDGHAKEGSDDKVRENTPYKIHFSSLPGSNCGNDKNVMRLSDAHSPYWTTVPPLWKFVTTDPLSPVVKFQVQKTLLGYKLVFCMKNSIPQLPICTDVGFMLDGLRNRLATGLGVIAEPFLFSSNTTIGPVENIKMRMSAAS